MADSIDISVVFSNLAKTLSHLLGDSDVNKAQEAEIQATIKELTHFEDSINDTIDARIAAKMGGQSSDGDSALADRVTALEEGLASLGHVFNGDQGEGNDTGSDTTGGDTSTSTVTGGQGDDTIDAGSGDDTVSGGQGNDTVSGADTSTDTTSGGQGADTVTGATGDDTLNTVAAQNTIAAGAGNDQVDPDPGAAARPNSQAGS